ncbi:MAG: HPF/RaiA family ribosome-associated protein [Synechococcales bacterium]|nr:HPF/RaiA family ribosome-associated protein [Synechococcales bacterium]
MRVPLEVSYRGVEKTDALDALIQEKVGKLEEVCSQLSSCRIGVEKTHVHPDSGSPYRVRIDMTVPPGHELAATKNPGEGTQYVPLETVIRDTFDAARRQLVELNRREQDEVKRHPDQEMDGIVKVLYPDKDYGFIKALDGEDVYFNRGSVLNDDFDRMEVGTGVHFFKVQAEQGPRASTVKIVDKPGIEPEHGRAGDMAASPPGWQ